MKTKSFFLVRRLILIVLVLLLALSSIQAVGTLWGGRLLPGRSIPPHKTM